LHDLSPNAGFLPPDDLEAQMGSFVPGAFRRRTQDLPNLARKCFLGIWSERGAHLEG
jgi:hypothetical protein